MKTFLTADPHFCHDAIRRFEPRPFDSVAQMDEALIGNWNQIVEPRDEVWILGDYALGDREKALGYLPRLNGTKYLVVGNHDRPSVAMPNGHRHQRRYFEAGFEAVLDFVEISLTPLTKKGPGLRVMLSHYPYSGEHGDLDERHRQLRLRDLGKPLVHGHIHREWTTHESELGTPMVNVGVDRWDYTPVPAQDIHRLIRHRWHQAQEKWQPR